MPESDPTEQQSAIIVIDGDPLSRNAAEDLEDDLDRQVIAMDSSDFDLDGSEEILEAGAFIVAWDLAIRSGADLIESLRQDERLADRPILVASDRVDRGLVRAALSVGADGVCRHPYEAEEVRARLMVAERKRSPAAA
jgi:DNA-binding response OmpR family regulator